MSLGKSKSNNESSGVQQQQLPPWVLQASQGIVGNAGWLAEPFLQDRPEEAVAPFSPDQLQAFDQARAFAAGPGKGQATTPGRLGYNTYTDIANGQAPTMDATSYNPAQMQAAQAQAAGNVQAGTGAAAMSPYQNIYEDQVVNSTMNSMDRERQKALSGLGMRQAASGAFGGGRHGVAEGELLAQDQLNRANVVSGLRQQGFNTAIQAGQQDASRSLQAQGMNQAAQLQQLGTNASLQQQANSANMGARNAAGQYNASNQQSANNANMNAYLQNLGYRMQGAGGMGNSWLGARGYNDQRALQGIDLLGQIGQTQQDQYQRVLDTPWTMLQRQAGLLGMTPYPTTTTTQGNSRGSGFNFSANQGSFF